MKINVHDNVMLNCIEGFGGPARVVEVRDADCPYRVELNDGSQPSSWYHAGEVELMGVVKPPKHDSRVATFEHIQFVRRFICRVIADLQQRQQIHDQSKLLPPEVDIFDKYTPKLADCTYGSEEYKGFLAAMEPALNHHYAVNSHHPEHFANGIRGMSLLDLVEMLCDWKAATLRHKDGDIRRSIEMNQKRFGYSDELKGIFLNSLMVLETAL